MWRFDSSLLPEVASPLRRVSAAVASAVEVFALPQVLPPVDGARQGERVGCRHLLPLLDLPGGTDAADEVF